MNVKLISFSEASKEMIDEGIDNAQELIAFCARVSNPANQLNTETSEKLIRYLVKHKHWSPLEMVSACLEITTTRDIARQILRHRSFSFQEFSQRYADPTAELDLSNDEQRNLAYEWERAQKRVLFSVKQEYQWAIKNGIAKEQARAVLPEGLTVSRLYMNGTLRSWIHFIELRSANGTQKEHQEVAKMCATVIAQAFPMASEFVQTDS